ncbi:recombination directionality factor [Ralstonia sp. 25C]|uniref:recombination directionality factor n=1 Tax=Ralstonia sp. 25C TaxID=3447363 RepID=UPI003F754334
MLKGLAITPPIIGRVSIGRVVERNGKRRPEKDDQFTLTTQVQNRGEWVLHPLNESLRKAGGAGKLRSIPVRMLFNDPNLNLRAEYTLFDRETGRPVCVGNGERCKRVDGGEIAILPCPSPEGCQFGGPSGCKPFGRLNVIVGDEDEMGSFILRTTSWNSIRTLAARLHYFGAVSGNLLACLPLELKLRGKSTARSFRSAIYYVDVSVRAGKSLEDAITEARELDARRKSVGFDQAALDATAKIGFANGTFEDSSEEAAAVVEEFYPEADNPAPGTPDEADAANAPTLRDKLDRKATLPSSTSA